MTRIEGEVALLVIATETIEKVPEPTGTNMVFNAPVGVVQTGAGSVGIAHQHIDTEAAKVLADALSKLLQSLGTVPVSAPLNIDEVRALAQETQSELAQPKPNVTKVRGFIVGIGQAIQFVPHLKNAYEAIKWAAAFINLNLP